MLGHFGQGAGAPTPLHRERGASCPSSAAGDIDREERAAGRKGTGRVGVGEKVATVPGGV